MKCTCDLCPKHSILFAYGPVTACTNEATSSFIGEETGKRWDVCPECDKHAYNANEGMFGVALDEDLEGNPRKV